MPICGAGSSTDLGCQLSDDCDSADDTKAYLSYDSDDDNHDDNHQDIVEANEGWPKEAHYVPAKPGVRTIGLLSQPKTLQTVIRASIDVVLGEALSKTFYPSPDDAVTKIRKILRKSAREFGFEELVDRFTKDVEFGSAVAKLVCLFLSL